MRSVLHALVLCSLSATLLAQTPATPKWDVTAPFGPTTNVTFETSEGTWMSVDVSPDGRTLVFDLLGDIYTMPIAGGTATRILGGPAFEMQPRFSPDGQRIAFATDRGGLWNIWTARVDGSDPKQISTEARWYINSPTWSPDGRMIYARRHFVGTRSAGAGEVWMYHASGTAGAGIQVTRRDNDQKDAGEPAISPDGKYLYYSKDVTPGSTFEYNKDPHGVIFAILRRNLATGEESRLVTRPGGSIAPRPSPDGRYLAFIRRVDLGSELFLKDLQTGEEFSIFNRLDKDLQEAWTIHGVYAQYAWTPDSRRLVIWGEGKLWNVDVETKQGLEIPFTAQVDQTITPAVRFRVPVFEERFDVKMLRDAQVSPDGRQVAFSALGGLYIRPLSDGEPRPLEPNGYLNKEGDLVQDGVWNNATRSSAEGGSWRLDPAWSPNGEQIVYAAWDDRELGRVFTIDVQSGRGREVVADPGHYIEPSFSPDGRWIAYRKTTGDGTRTSAGSMEPGLYIVPADGSAAPRLVREGGSEPQFDHTGERLYFREQREQFVLASVDLEGNDERVHLQSPNATEIVPSPDGRWVAFSERWHLHVMPFPQTGRPVEIGPASRGMPVGQISRDAGFFVHWSGDGQRVHWLLGPELFTRELARTFGFLTEGAAPGAEPEATGRNIGFTTASARPTGVKALTGARIITLAQAPGTQAVIENGTILVDGNRITAVGPSNRVTIPAGAERIDLRGKTIMPGIIDAHAHVGSEGSGIPAQQSWPLLANLAFGVTTLHDPSNDLEVVFANAEMIRAGLKPGPRLFSTGRILYGAETNFKAEIDNYEDALSHLRRLKAVGAASVKSYNQQRRDVRQMILKAARALELNVVPEGGSVYYGNATHVMDGHTTVEHNIPVPVLYDDIVTVFAKSGVGYTPTLVVSYGSLSGEFYWYQHMNVWEHPRLLQFVPADVVNPRSRRRQMAAEGDYGHILIAQGARKLLDAGVPVNMGAHGQLQGLGAHWEMWMMAQGGMTPMEVLKTATINPAVSLGYDTEIGSIEVGKLADLLVLDRNPLEDIRNTDSMFRVMLNGQLFDQQLNPVGGPARRPFWFEGR